MGQDRIYDFAVALAGWTRGGLAHVNIIGSVIFAGMNRTFAERRYTAFVHRDCVAVQLSRAPGVD